MSFILDVNSKFSLLFSWIYCCSFATNESTVSDVRGSVTPGIWISTKLREIICRNLARCLCSAVISFCCSFLSPSNLSMPFFIFSMCLLRMAFCSSNSVFTFLSFLSSFSRAGMNTKRTKEINKVHTVFLEKGSWSKAITYSQCTCTGSSYMSMHSTPTIKLLAVFKLKNSWSPVKKKKKSGNGTTALFPHGRYGTSSCKMLQVRG